MASYEPFEKQFVQKLQSKVNGINLEGVSTDVSNTLKKDVIRMLQTVPSNVAEKSVKDDQFFKVLIRPLAYMFCFAAAYTKRYAYAETIKNDKKNILIDWTNTPHSLGKVETYKYIDTAGNFDAANAKAVLGQDCLHSMVTDKGKVVPWAQWQKEHDEQAKFLKNFLPFIFLIAEARKLTGALARHNWSWLANRTDLAGSEMKFKTSLESDKIPLKDIRKVANAFIPKFIKVTWKDQPLRICYPDNEDLDLFGTTVALPWMPLSMNAERPIGPVKMSMVYDAWKREQSSRTIKIDTKDIKDKGDLKVWYNPLYFAGSYWDLAPTLSEHGLKLRNPKRDYSSSRRQRSSHRKPEATSQGTDDSSSRRQRSSHRNPEATSPVTDDSDTSEESVLELPPSKEFGLQFKNVAGFCEESDF